MIKFHTFLIIIKTPMLQLDKSLFIAKGSRRECYCHPEDPHICIKITFRTDKRDENKREARFINKWQDLDQVPISRPLQWFDTNLGRGLGFQLISDYTGNISRSIAYYDLYPQEIGKNQLNQDLALFKEKLLNSSIPVRDLVAGNVVYQRLSPHTGRFIVIDGIGKSTLLTTKNKEKKRMQEQFNRYFSHLFY